MSSLVISFNASTCWFLWICCLKREGKSSRKISEIGRIENTELIYGDFVSCSSPAWLLADELIPKSLFCCHSARISYVLEASFFKFWADFCFLIWVLLDPFLYPPQSFSSPFLFHFISTLWVSELAASFALDLSPFKSFSWLLFPSFSISESVSLALSF